MEENLVPELCQTLITDATENNFRWMTMGNWVGGEVDCLADGLIGERWLERLR